MSEIELRFKTNKEALAEIQELTGENPTEAARSALKLYKWYATEVSEGKQIHSAPPSEDDDRTFILI